MTRIPLAAPLALSAALCGLPAGAAPILPFFDPGNFVPGAAIDNPYFPVTPRTRLVLKAAGIDEDGEPFNEKTVLTGIAGGPVLAGVQTQTQHDKAYEGRLLVEETFDYYAQDIAGNVWYMGEDVTNYHYDDDGVLIGTDSESAWLAGVNGAEPGWIMPAVPVVGLAYYQEFAIADDALDEAEIWAVGEVVSVPAGDFANVLKIYETTALDPESREFKYFAPGIGVIRADEGLSPGLTDPELVFELVRVTQVPLPAGLPLAVSGLLAIAALRRRAAP